MHENTDVLYNTFYTKSECRCRKQFNIYEYDYCFIYMLFCFYFISFSFVLIWICFFFFSFASWFSVDGGELFDRVIDDEFVLTEKTCTVFVRQLCQAMEFVHSNNILHLDLKPENILCLTREGNRIKIIDFGLARRYDPDKKLQVSVDLHKFSIFCCQHWNLWCLPCK